MDHCRTSGQLQTKTQQRKCVAFTLWIEEGFWICSDNGNGGPDRNYGVCIDIFTGFNGLDAECAVRQDLYN